MSGRGGSSTEAGEIGSTLCIQRRVLCTRASRGKHARPWGQCVTGRVPQLEAAFDIDVPRQVAWVCTPRRAKHVSSRGNAAETNTCTCTCTAPARASSYLADWEASPSCVTGLPDIIL